MKILFWTPIFWPDIGGIELISLRHIQSLKERGHDFVVITSHGRVETPAVSNLDGIPVYRFPILSAFQDKDLHQVLVIQKEIENIKKSFSPDLNHLNFGGPTPIGFFYLRTAAVAPAPLIVALHGSVLGLDTGTGSITGRVLRAASWTTACSTAMLEDACQVLPGISQRSSVAYPGCSATEISPTPLPFENARILCLGRLVPEKGFDLAIQAFASVVERHPQARLVIAGDGPERFELERQVAELQLKRVVDFTGEVQPQEVFALINKASMVVVPSRWREAFGLVALEAAQMARPVVASRVGGLTEAVLDEQTGLLFAKEDSRALAGAMAYLLDHPDIAAQMGQNGRARALSQFTWQKYIDTYDALYHMQDPGNSA